MRIVSEEWLSEPSKEAVVTLQSEDLFVAAFSHPYTMSLGDTVSDPLHVFDPLSVVRSDTHEPSITRQSDSLAHELTAKIEDREKGLISAGGFKFEVEEPLPSDLCDGEMVNIVCRRIDLW